jgi:aminocarboxymuconate-semialdehyde decarboxylase
MTEPTASTSDCVDVHAHIVPRALLNDLASRAITFPHVEVAPHESTFTVSFNGGAPTRPVSPGLQDGERRREWMRTQGVEQQLVGGWLDIFGYDLPAAEGAEWSQALTESIRDTVRGDPRLTGLGSVPLQDPDRAAQALREQRAAGLPGIMIATRAAGRELDDPTFTPFWEAADDTGAIVFLHPGFGGASDRYHDFGLVNGLARLEDTTVTLARLLYAGIPARYPGARIIVAHGGAGLPYVLGRLARNHAINPGTADPLESFAQLYFDSVVFDPDALRFLLAKAGHDRVLLGSDYPFPIGDLAPRGIVDLAGLDTTQGEAVLAGNAQRLLTGETP